MIENLIRENIRNLKPYSSARDTYSKGILLDANENSFGSVVELYDEELNRYPDPHQFSMRKSLGEYLNVLPQKLFFGVGSDEIIDLLIRIFCYPGKDSVMVTEPTYGMYKVAADINNVHTETTLLDDDFDIKASGVLSRRNANCKIIFICSPNNPTGNLIDKNTVKNLLQNSGSIIVVDEAYIDFTPKENSFIDLIDEYPNLVILRTFSKAWGLAGIRLGYCIANEIVINYLFKVKSPYNINSLTRSAFHKAMQNISLKDEFIISVLREKEFLMKSLQEIKEIEKVYPSDANYILIKIKNASNLQKRLAENGVIIRDRSNQPKLENCLRITVGTHFQNELLLKLLSTIISEQVKK